MLIIENGKIITNWYQKPTNTDRICAKITDVIVRSKEQDTLHLERRRLASVRAPHASTLPRVFLRKEPAERNSKPTREDLHQ